LSVISRGSHSSSLMAMAAIAGAAVATLGMVASTSMASAVIYQDNFSGTSTTPLNGAAPTVDNGSSATWTANTYAVWSDSGYTTYALDQSGKTRDSAYLGFTPISGQVYTLSATLTITGVDSAPGNDSLDIGFPGNIQAGTNPLGGTSTLNTGWDWPASISNVYASPWVLLNASGGGTYFTGPYTEGSGTMSSTAAVGSANNIAITLNTGASAWTYQVFDNSNAVSPVVTFTTNPTITAIGLQNAGVIGTVSNFSLTDVAVPEPATLALAAAGGLVLLLLKRRRRA
ncbi:MAG: PEP-CTERM sorting domain-containing protein, partial [Phycisphaerae bacterium]